MTVSAGKLQTPFDSLVLCLLPITSLQNLGFKKNGFTKLPCASNEAGAIGRKSTKSGLTEHTRGAK